MVSHTIRFVTILYFISQAIISFGQCENSLLYRQFNLKQSNFKAVTFVIEKIRINYNSWDYKSDVDTTKIKEKFWGIREGDHFKFLKIGIDSINSHSYIYYMDTVAFFSNKLNAYRYDITDNIKYAEFGEAFWFLHNRKDTFLKCLPEDTVQLIDNNSFLHICHFEDDYGTGISKSTYTFNNKGILIQYENFFNQDFFLPKYYTKSTFSEIKYYKEVPTSISKKIESKYNNSVREYRNTKLKKIDSSNYTIIQEKKSQLKEVYKFKKSVSLDSIITQNKVTLVYFWFEGCGPCHQLKPKLLDIYNEYHSQGLELVGLNNKDKEIFIDTSYSLFITYYDKLKNNKSLKVNGYPTVLIFNNEKEVLGCLVGSGNFGINEMKKHILTLLSN